VQQQCCDASSIPLATAVTAGWSAGEHFSLAPSGRTTLTNLPRQVRRGNQ